MKKCRHIQLLVLDVDGVMTDGTVFVGPEGEALKQFNMRDGMGLEMIRAAGVGVAVVTGENSSVVRARCRKLEISDLYEGIKDKKSVVSELARKKGVSLDEIVFVGDDVNDLEVMKSVGTAISVCDGDQRVKEIADYVTLSKGGKGAIREVCELLLSAREK